jgi:hypothetical protein
VLGWEPAWLPPTEGLWFRSSQLARLPWGDRVFSSHCINYDVQPACQLYKLLRKIIYAQQMIIWWSEELWWLKSAEKKS